MTGKQSKIRVSLMLVIMITAFLSMEGSALAKTPQFRLDMDNLNLEKGVSANLTFSMINAKGAEVVDVKGLENFDVVSKSNSTSTQIINGDATYEQDSNYIIMPKNTGEFKLQGIVKYNGSTYETNELQIRVSQGDTEQKGEVKELFLKTILSNDKVYFGQKVVLSYELYSRYNIEDFGFVDSMNTKDFISKEIPDDKLKANYTYIDGKKYVKYEAKQMILSPIKAGTFTIPSYNFQVNVSTGDFFNSSKPVYLQTDSKELTVKSLPQTNQPEKFSGIVGNLNLEGKYNKQEVNYGDSITLQVTASGNCNLDDLKKMVRDDLPGFSVYQTEKNTEEIIEDNQYKVKKEFEVILVPEETGDINMDPIEISYFNPKSGTYEQAEIPGATITVKGEAPQSQIGGINKKSQVETIKIDQVSYNSPNKDYFTIQIKKRSLSIGLLIFVILLIAITLFFSIFLYRKRQDKKLQEIYKQIKNTDNQNEVYNLLNNMIKYRFNISLKASSRNDIINELSGQEICQPILEIIDYMEYDRYSSKSEINLKEKIKSIYNMLKNSK